jgi:thymidylate synthase ThyX
LPIFVYRQLFRHRTASQLEPEVADCISNDTAFQTFSVQIEMSGRYVEMPDHYYLPEPGAIHIQSLDNKQGRSEGGLSLAERMAIRGRLEAEIREMRAWYGKSLDMNLAKELARANLPLSQYTLLIWKIDLKNLLHFIRLRIHPHAQYEVREYARALLAVVWSTFPVTAQAFDDYELGAQRFSRMEMQALLAQLSPNQRAAAVAAYKSLSGNAREVGEFGGKLGV